MDEELVREQPTAPDRLDHHQSTPEQKAEPEQRRTLEYEPISDQGVPRNQQIPPTPEGNEQALHKHQRYLRTTYPSFDLSEVSYHTELTGFPGSRHSSINSEPLTLDADQIHEAKDQAADLIQRVDTTESFENFTKDTLNTIMGRVSMMEYYWRHGQDLQNENNEALPSETEAHAFTRQINISVEKARQKVEANEQQQPKLVKKSTGEVSALTFEDRKSPRNLAAGYLEEEVQLKAD